jgi:hypothetical protein
VPVLVRLGRVVGARLSAFVVGVAIATTSGTALAREREAAPLELDWEAPPGCLDRDAARAAIQDVLGTTAITGHPVVRVRIAETHAGRFGADIWMYDAAGGGERSFEGASCLQVAQATALIVAFVLQSNQAASSPAEHRARKPASVLDQKNDGSSAGVSIALGARANGDLGSLPHAAPGGAVVLALFYGRLRAEADASAFVPQSSYNGPVTGSGGEFALYVGGVRGCFDLLPASARAWDLGPCAAAEAGMVTGRGIGIRSSGSTRVFWGAGLLGLSLLYLEALPIGLGMLAEAGVPVHRPVWQIEQFGPVFQPATVIGRASVSVSWRFP